VAIYKTLQLSV